MADGFKRDTELNIYQRLHLAASELRAIEKDEKANFKGGGYAYVSHDAVTAHVRGALLKHGVIVVPSVESCRNDGNRTEMEVAMTFVNIDAPDDDDISVKAVGYGVDASDKGPGKAYSYAVKMCYLKMLMLNAGEDIERDDIAHDPATSRESQVAEREADAKKAIETAAKNLKAAIDGAQTVKELMAVQRANKDWLMGVAEVTREYFINHIEARKSDLRELEEAGEEELT